MNRRLTWGIAFGGVSFGEELVLECVEDEGVVLLLLLPRWQFRGGDPTAVKREFNSAWSITEIDKKAWLFAKLQPGRARGRINAT